MNSPYQPTLSGLELTRRPLTLLALVAVFGACLGGEQPSPAGAKTHSSPIRSLKAYPYLHGRGEFGREDLVPGKLALWNTPFGGGDVASPSSVTLVMVELNRPASETRHSLQVRLTAQANGQPLLRQDVQLAIFSGDSRTITVPFLIYATGCGQLDLTAEILGGDTPPDTAVRAAVPFTCGE